MGAAQTKHFSHIQHTFVYLLPHFQQWVGFFT